MSFDHGGCQLPLSQVKAVLSLKTGSEMLFFACGSQILDQAVLINDAPVAEVIGLDCGPLLKR